MKINAITIEREYGSGGTKIAKLLSKQADIPCYGREILEELSKQYNISIDDIQKYEETVTNSFLYSFYMMAKATSPDAERLTGDGKLYIAEQKIIERLSMSGPAIFLGHCASEALRDKENVIKVFIRSSDDEQKKKRIVDDYKISAEEAVGVAKRFDKKRSNYYNANTGKKWNDYSNYDIVLDSAVLGIDGCVSVLMGLLK